MISYFKQIKKFCDVKKKIFLLKADMPQHIIDYSRQNKEKIVKKNNITSICRDELGEKPIAILKLADAGTFHSIYNVKFSKKREVIIRTNIVNQAYSGPDFYFDKYISKRLNDIGLPTLNIYHINITRNIYPFDYQIMEKAKGVTINSITSQRRFKKSVAQLGNFVAKYHKIKIPKFGPLNLLALLKDGIYIGLHDSWPKYLLLNLEQHIKLCVLIRAITVEEANKIRKKFDCHEYYDFEDGSLLHGDLGNQNVFFDNNRISSLVDWEDCIVGDPVFDIAYWGSFYRNDTQKLRDVFLREYTKICNLPKNFLIRYWLYYLRIVLAKTVHRCKFNYSDLNECKIKKALAKLDELGI